MGISTSLPALVLIYGLSAISAICIRQSKVWRIHIRGGYPILFIRLQPWGFTNPDYLVIPASEVAVERLFNSGRICWAYVDTP
ncbi:hypothetical protein POJ06DRAFT_247523 [Lipomyces tetrasporus]|uniref:Uncharacterized protein n=1 Tax=Lipomyces tetrasporus TaxID=54092 RepID=A0AAD7QUI8_9ASCO|nr:uncharacterized protein POJ06DRAFT_247523 [Lipomyces tetrasporus]KAJ8101654.1 hypothetical protein POJ06DRAFT_247523 [Lipomyces tetrasporus]